MASRSYLAQPQATAFAHWLGEHLDNATLAHAYEHRKTGPWRCSSLFNAFEQYHWPQKKPLDADFAASSATLNCLAQRLRAALAAPGCDQSAYDAAVAVMQWGGVVAGNVRWLGLNSAGLAATLASVQRALDQGQVPDDIRFNAGMTKVYSLLCQSLIIYDSRVAAALGWAVVKFCQVQGLQALPDALNFPWAPAKGGTKQRNPSTEALKFSPLRSGAPHAHWNLKASWLLEAALASPAGQNSRFGALGSAAQQLRALEAALFMIGYDLVLLPVPAASTRPPSAAAD